MKVLGETVAGYRKAKKLMEDGVSYKIALFRSQITAPSFRKVAKCLGEYKPLKRGIKKGSLHFWDEV